MPPNVLYSWDSDAAKRHYRDLPGVVNIIGDDDDDDDDDGYHHHQQQQPEFDPKLFLPYKTPKSLDDGDSNDDNDARALWKKILRKDDDISSSATSTTTSTTSDDDRHREATTILLLNNDNDDNFDSDDRSYCLLTSLSSIVVLDDEAEKKDWLNRFDGQLSVVSSELLQELRKHAPGLNTMSTVADFNDNLFYHMQQERGLEHFPGIGHDTLRELEGALLQQANEYLGSFLTTKSSIPQPAHVDYPWEVLEKHAGDQSLKLAFFPLTEEGMFLQIWPHAAGSGSGTMPGSSQAAADRSTEKLHAVEGEIVFIPYGKLLIVPASTIHGGGFRTTPLPMPLGREEIDAAAAADRSSSSNNTGSGGNLRFHLYIATKDASLPAHQTNKYTERFDKTKELSRRYVDSKHMQILLESFFV